MEFNIVSKSIKEILFFRLMCNFIILLYCFRNYSCKYILLIIENFIRRLNFNRDGKFLIILISRFYYILIILCIFNVLK